MISVQPREDAVSSAESASLAARERWLPRREMPIRSSHSGVAVFPGGRM